MIGREEILQTLAAHREELKRYALKRQMREQILKEAVRAA